MSTCKRSKIIGAAPIVALTLAPLFTASAQGETFKVLHVFAGQPGGAGPLGTPLYAGGMLFGTTNGAGTIFLLNTQTEKEITLYTFSVPGAGAVSSVIGDGNGNLYGTTEMGGSYGSGTVFKLDSTGALTVLHSFKGPDGSSPLGPVVRDGQGNLYGTTKGGGASDAGTIYKLDPTGKLTTVHSFAGPTDGAFPTCGLLIGDGSLFGTTPGGGTFNMGVVFRLSLSTRKMSVLHHFAGGSDGAAPYGGVISDGLGNLYGTTAQGGSVSFGAGTIFKLNVKTGKESILHMFAGVDGSFPYARLTHDAQGNLYGATVYGGLGSDGGYSGYGTLFKLGTDGILTTLYSFTNGPDGANPYAGLAIDGAGHLYGAVNGYIGGSIFEITQ